VTRTDNCLAQGSPTWCPRAYQVARKDHVGRPRACSKNNISMINVFTNTKIMEGKLSKIFISVCSTHLYQTSRPPH